MMKKTKWALAVALMLLLAIPSFSYQEEQKEQAEPQAPRPIGLKDILAWKNIRNSVISNDRLEALLFLRTPSGWLS